MTRQGRAAGRADVVIVGAGIVGCSIAFQLASRGAERIALLDRDTPGQGSTSKATGGFRHQFATQVNIELSIESVKLFEQFRDVVGADLDMRRSGYLFVSEDPARGDVMQRNVALQRSLGVPSSVVGAEEATRLVPGLVVSPMTVGTYCAADGVASPTDACAGFLAAARRLGVEVHAKRRVVGIDLHGDRVIGVRTESGSIACDSVVLAAGVWTPEVADSVGVALPIRPHHRQAFMTKGDAGIPHEVPFTVDLDSGAYFHREGEGMIIGGTDHGDERGFDQRLDWSQLPTLIEALTRRLPSAEDLEIQSGWAGLREMTPDEHGLVGAIPSVSGLYIAAGFSGHGFMHSPAVGRVVADLVLTGKCEHPDITPLYPLRFSDGTISTRDSQSF
jgi:sarcosine oxidase, subunit beta